MKLTEVAKAFKAGLVFLVGFMGVYYISILIVFPVAGTLIKAIIPDRNPPQTIFGLLSPLEFVEKAIDGTPIYELNTKSGRLPSTMPDKMYVFKYKSVPFSYVAGKTAIQDASVLGYTDPDLITDLKSDVYKWRNLQTGTILEIKINGKELTSTTQLTGKDYLYPKGTVTIQKSAETSKSMLKMIGRFDDPLYTTGTQTVKMGKYFGAKVIETNNPEEAQVAKVDFFRKIKTPKEIEYKILGPDPKKGLLSVQTAALPENYNSYNKTFTSVNFPNMEVYYWEIDTNTQAVYPIIGVNQAWTLIKQGKGVITNVTAKEGNPFEPYTKTRIENIIINDVYLAYYDTPAAQTYLQPIYVFEGNYKTSGTNGGSISIYFPAVAGQHIQGNTTETK